MSKLFIVSNLLLNAQPGTVFGVYWDFTNSSEYIASIALNSGAISPVNSLSNVTSWSSGTSTFDNSKGYYIFRSNLGITVVNSQNGNIINTFPVSSNLGGLEYFNGRMPIKDDPFSDNVTIFPNPVSNNVLIEINSITSTDLNFIIYNSLGEMVYNHNYMVTENTKNTINLDMNSLPKGLYTLKINSLDGTISDIRNFVKID